MDEFSAYEKLVFRIVGLIPRGKVATYGQIAFLTGFPGRARMVGHALSRAPARKRLPCHRVVNHAGRTAPGWEAQKPLLEKEGIKFRSNGYADLGSCLWEGFLPGSNDIG